MPLYLFSTIVTWGIVVSVMLMIRSGEPAGSWLRVRGIAKILSIATAAALIVLLFSLPTVTMAEPT